MTECISYDIEQRMSTWNILKDVIYSRYHIILDCAKVGYKNIPPSWKYDTYITLNSPLLVNTDKYGLIPGLVESANNLLSANLNRFKEGSSVKWGFFVPSNTGFQFIDALVREGKVSYYFLFLFGILKVICF